MGFALKFAGKPGAEPDKPYPFGLRDEWLALRGVSPETAISVSKLEGVRRANWQDAIKLRPASLWGRKVFVTPKLGDWILVLNYRLPSYRKQDLVVDHLSGLSRDTNGRVCYFNSLPMVNLHAWGLAENGITSRLYAFSDGKLIFNHGEVSVEERDLGVRFWHKAVSEENETSLAGAKTVLAMADRWSLDPSRLGVTFNAPGLGYITKQGK